MLRLFCLFSESFNIAVALTNTSYFVSGLQSSNQVCTGALGTGIRKAQESESCNMTRERRKEGLSTKDDF